MAENSKIKVPVASHGLHRHDYNYPCLTSLNFCEVAPVYVNEILKGERDEPKSGVFAQLNPVVHNAFVTGRFNYKAIFVPYKFVWRPYYNFVTGKTYTKVNGNTSLIERYPFILDNELTKYLITPAANYLVNVDGPLDHLPDLTVRVSANNVETYDVASQKGACILRILINLGLMPTWDKESNTPYNILALLCYLKAFYDYYFPVQYKTNSIGVKFERIFNYEDSDFNPLIGDIFQCLEYSLFMYYDNSIFCNAWDNPLGPNAGVVESSYVIHDASNNASFHQVVSNDPTLVDSPSRDGSKPTNGTPFIGGSAPGQSSATGVLTEYILNVLKNASNWARRHQLAGSSILDRFLLSRGIYLSNDSARLSYFMGQRNLEIDTTAVENNTDSNLGELGGKSLASTGKSPLSFKCRPDDDGIFLVIVCAVPDASQARQIDGFTLRKSSLDAYNPEFDKVGPIAVPGIVVEATNWGPINVQRKGTFGFMNQYWDCVEERPRLSGDFFLSSRGRDTLSAYHSFRTSFGLEFLTHSMDYLNSELDAGQYQRFFYSDKADNMFHFMRWHGSQYKFKLPLGDSFEWDDDELNKKVSVAIGGPEK